MARHFVAASSQVISVGNPTALQITGNALTLHCWVKPGATADKRICGKGTISAGNSLYGLITFTDNHFYGYIGAGAGNDQVGPGTTTYNTSTWYPVGIVKAGTGAAALKLYVNGAQDASVTSNRSVGNVANNFRIGADSGNTFFGGDIAEVAVWADSLTPSEMKALAAGMPPHLVHPDNLKGYWPLYGDSPEPDKAGNQSSGTVTGATVVPHPGVHIPAGFGRYSFSG